MSLGVDVLFQVEHREREWLRALERQDATAVSQLLHDEFTSTSARSSGEVIGKHEYVSAVRDLTLCRYELRDIVTRQVGDIAVFKARLICDSTFAQSEIHDDLLVTDVWVKERNRWLVLTRHASPVPNPAVR